jgi:hypothetical protein
MYFTTATGVTGLFLDTLLVIKGQGKEKPSMRALATGL